VLAYHLRNWSFVNHASNAWMQLTNGRQHALSVPLAASQPLDLERRADGPETENPAEQASFLISREALGDSGGDNDNEAGEGGSERVDDDIGGDDEEEQPALDGEFGTFAPWAQPYDDDALKQAPIQIVQRWGAGLCGQASASSARLRLAGSWRRRGRLATTPIRDRGVSSYASLSAPDLRCLNLIVKFIMAATPADAAAAPRRRRGRITAVMSVHADARSRQSDGYYNGPQQMAAS